MKVSKLIKMLEKLDQDKEILLDIGGGYLQEDGTYFKSSKSFDDLEIVEGYYLKTKDEVLFEEKRDGDEEKGFKETIKIAKKYMKQEGYEKVEREGMCYCFD